MRHLREFPMSNEVQKQQNISCALRRGTEVAERYERVNCTELSTNSVAVHADYWCGTSQRIPAWTRLFHSSTPSNYLSFP